MQLDCPALIDPAAWRLGQRGSGSDDDAASPAGAPCAPIDAAKRRILVVEDDWFIAIQIETCLTDAGYDVVASVADAESAVDSAQRERPDLVLMDIRLSGEQDGIAAAQEIFRHLGVRSLFVSAHVDDHTVARAQGAAPLGWVQKPFTERELLEAVAAVIPPRDAS